MSSQLIFYSLDAIAVFSALLFGTQVLLRNPKELNARIIALICFDSICAVALSRYEMSAWIPAALQLDVGILRLPFHIARNITPGLLMILSYSLFQDEKRFPRWLIVAFVVQVAMEALISWIEPANTSQYAVLRTIPAALELMFIVFTFYWLLNSWRADVVQARRQLRIVFLGITGTITFVDVLLGRLVIPWNTQGQFYLHVALSIFLLSITIMAFINLHSGQPSYIDPFRDEKKPQQIEPAPSERAENHDATVAAILTAFRDHHLYREGELTIASLAAKLALPEYRVRKAIHEQLGYRNFNALLHDYRVAEACRDLSDPKKDHLPILTIALTVGYNSINPFNRAFRDAKGMTPSVFRAQAQGKLSPIPEN